MSSPVVFFFFFFFLFCFLLAVTKRFISFNYSLFMRPYFIFVLGFVIDCSLPFYLQCLGKGVLSD